ncbi:Cullin-associated NEDD8-dissociated protein 1 [Blomia tropicalis]|nr:Cullin-associated NEDD8-dissociated protein 1 [Blomia tropicalis]
MSGQSYQVGNLIQKMSSNDKDFRFMATNDLLVELQHDSIKLDDDTEKKIVKTLLSLLKDNNAEVQNLAVKCLGPLITKVKEAQVDNIVETLCSNMLADDDILKETSSIGLKTVISVIPIDANNLISAVCKNITGRLINAISQQQNVSIQLDTLEIFSDLLFRFGSVMSLYYNNIKEALMPQLNNSRSAVCKRAITCIAYITISCSDQLYDEILNHLLSELQKTEINNTKIYVNCITVVCKHSGSRMDPYLKSILEFAFEFVNSNDDDLKEACFQIFDIFVRRCPKEVSQYIQQEREENVKVDIFSTYIALLRQTRAIIGNSENSDKFVSILRNQVPQIVRSLDRQLKEKSIKTRLSCFALLSELVNILPNALADPSTQADQKKNFLNNIIPGILYSLNSNNSTSSMKIEALAFLNVLLKTHKPEVFQNYFSALITEIKKAVSDQFYKITSEALLVMTQIIPIIRPSIQTPCDSTMKSFIDSMYTITLQKLVASEVDQEVKERAITCMAQLICTFGDVMGNLQEAFTLFLERLKNEVTRLTCVKACIKIVSVKFPQPLDLSPLFPKAFEVLAPFLRQNKRSLKFNTLLLIDAACKNYNNYTNTELNETILNQMPVLISESDLYISQLALTTITSMILSHKSFNAIIPQSILPEALVLIRSPLLQGNTLNAMLDFFRSIVQSGFPGLDYNELIVRLTQPIMQPNQNLQPLSKQAYYSISKCIAAISLLNEKTALTTVSNLIQQVQKPSILPNSHPDSVQLYSLLTIAEIGKKLDLESVQEQIQEAILESFNSNNKDVKSAASICLGSVSVGNLERYLPFVLYGISQKQRRQYLLLNALKEIINCSANDTNLIQHLQPHIKSIWDLLIEHANSVEEGTRYVVAECLGKVTLINYEIFLPELIKNLSSESSYVRDTVITAVRFTISDAPHDIDLLLKNYMNEVLKTLEDVDINVRRVALNTFNSTIHNKPTLVRDSLETILPLLYKETKVKAELVREVEMGPFKHTVDDGLDLRKAAYECMYTLLESCLDRIEMFEFLNHVEGGLKDNYDIKMLNYLIVIRLADLFPSALLQRLDSIVQILKETCQAKLKANAVKQEHEKQDELRRSAIRAFISIYKVPDADKNAFANDLMAMLKRDDLKPLLESVQNSNKANNEIPMEIEI